jgi:hypothetical protein
MNLRRASLLRESARIAERGDAAGIAWETVVPEVLSPIQAANRLRGPAWSGLEAGMFPPLSP